MPNVGVLNLNPRETGATALGAGLSKYLDMSADRELERRDSRALEQIINKHRGAQDRIQKTFFDIQTNPEISNHRKVSATKDLLDMERYNFEKQKDAIARLEKQRENEAKIIKEQKEEAEKKDKIDREKAAALKKQQDAEEERKREIDSNYILLKEVYPDDLPRAQREAELHSPATVRDIVSRANKPEKPEKPSAYQTAYEKAIVKERLELDKELPQAKDALKNVQHVRNLFNRSLTGAGGYWNALWKSADATEVETLGFTLLEPIIKLFNPVGPIPVQKLKIIQTKFQPNPWDLKEQFEGKMNSLERIGNQLVARLEQRKALLDSYGEKVPPKEELEKFDEDTIKFIDQIEQEETNKLSSISNQSQSGQKAYYSKATGKKLKQLPPEQIQDLLQKGLITDVAR